MLLKCHARRFDALVGLSRCRLQSLDINGSGGYQNDRFGKEAGACSVLISELAPDWTEGLKPRDCSGCHRENGCRCY
jgi:predicted CxxxxCH...CXXCH cytochrome family protein